MIWIVGEYAERIDNADELLESFLDNFTEENAQVQLQLLTAIVKLFLKRPTGTQELVQKVLGLSTQVRGGTWAKIGIMWAASDVAVRKRALYPPHVSVTSCSDVASLLLLLTPLLVFLFLLYLSVLDPPYVSPLFLSPPCPRSLLKPFLNLFYFVIPSLGIAYIVCHCVVFIH